MEQKKDTIKQIPVQPEVVQEITPVDKKDTENKVNEEVNYFASIYNSIQNYFPCRNLYVQSMTSHNTKSSHQNFCKPFKMY